MIRTTLGCAALLALSAAGLAQNVLFAEDFTNGIPATWSNRHLGIAMDPWRPGIGPTTSSPDVFHEWFCAHGFYFRDNLLVTPRIDLSGFSRVDFSCTQHQTSPLQRNVNRVEVSTDGGQNFTVVYTETGTWSGPGTIQVRLNAYAGLPDVRIAFHYQGTIANEWRIDDVRVTTPQPVHSVSGLTAGNTATLSLSGTAPNIGVLMGMSLSGPGPVPTPYGNVGLTPPVSLHFLITNAIGSTSMTIPVPASALGITLFSQAAALFSNGHIDLSNSRITMVQ
jgi:hypothetical protein